MGTPDQKPSPPPRLAHPPHVERLRPVANLQRPDAAMLLRAYGVGAFPMADGWNGRIAWFAPEPRGILPLDGLRVPKSLARVVRSGRFEIRIDSAIETVIRTCAGDRRSTPRSTLPAAPETSDQERRSVVSGVARDGADADDLDDDVSPCWMSAPLLDAYLELASIGHVHTVEAWRDGALVGGLYGVRLGSAFFGESMFCRPDAGGSDASKVCLVHLVRRLRAGGFTLLDTQMVTGHMRRFGAVEILHVDYMRRLGEALRTEAHWQP